MLVSFMSDMPLPSGLNAVCGAPRKPGLPASLHGPCCVLAASPTNGGTLGSTGPYSFDNSDPMLGHPPTLRNSFSWRPVVHWTASCLSRAPTTERMNANLSAIAAIFGKHSQIWMPVTLVLIGLNSPRISLGASVLISHMSWCGGPPPRNTLMTALCDVLPRLCSAQHVGQRELCCAKRERADLEEGSSGDAVAELVRSTVDGQHGECLLWARRLVASLWKGQPGGYGRTSESRQKLHPKFTPKVVASQGKSGASTC